MYRVGQTIRIKYPTKRDPDRVIDAYIWHIVTNESAPWPQTKAVPWPQTKAVPWLQTKAANGRKVYLYADSPRIVGIK